MGWGRTVKLLSSLRGARRGSEYRVAYRHAEGGLDGHASGRPVADRWFHRSTKPETRSTAKVLAAAALALSALTTTASAATLDFTFSFVNAGVNNGSGTATVTGIVRGLEDNATSAATSLEVLSNDDGFGIGSYDIANASQNEFTVSNGQIVDADFVVFGFFAEAPFVTDSTLDMGIPLIGTLIQGGLRQAVDGASSSPASAVTFTPVTAVPLPAGGVLLISGLVGLAALRRRPVNEA